MNENKKAQLNAQVKVIKAIAHQTRLFIVHELSKQERCVCELTKMIDSDVSTVSKHLSVLKNAGLVRGGDSPYPGANLYYPQNPDPLKPIYPVEGGGKLYAKAATASVRVTIFYWDDILTGVESD